MFDDVIREDGVMGGRWRLAGTTVPIADIRLDYLSWDHDEDYPYTYLNLTSDQIKSALTFEFPALYESTIQMLYASFTFGCVCGEETSRTLIGFDENSFDCACGRAWMMALTVKSVSKLAMTPI